MRVLFFLLFSLGFVLQMTAQNLRKAENLAQTGNFIEAKKIYETALSKQRSKCSDSTLLIVRGLLTTMISIGQLNEASQKAKEFIECRNKDMSSLYVALGAIHSIKGALDSSVYFYKKAIIGVSDE